jgi:hypothetical protein
MYPFYETLEYSHQFKQAREEANRARSKMGDRRKEKRAARKILVKKNGEPSAFMSNMEKPGRWVNRHYQSSGEFRSAYAYARSEHDYYSRAEY